MSSNQGAPGPGSGPPENGQPVSASPLRYPDFVLLTSGQLISAIGTQMQVVAVAWQIYLATNSKLALGLIGLARGLPLITASLVAGVVADAYDRRKVLLVTQATLALLSGLLASLTATGIITPWAIYLIIGGISAAQAVDQPSRTSLVPHLVPRQVLPRALAVLVATREFATIVGPALGGIVIAAMGVTPNYVVDTLSYGAVMLAVVLMAARVGHVATGKVNVGAVVEGWQFIIHNRIILSVQGLDFVANFFAASTILFPVFAHTIFRTGPAGLGLLYAAASAGAVMGAILFGLFGRARRQGIVILVSVFAYGLATMLFGFSPWFWVGLLMLGLSGAADSVSASLRGTISQLATPDHLRGRVTSVNTMFVAGGPQLGNVEAGAVATALGTREAVALGGFATMVAVLLVGLLSPGIRTYSWEQARAESSVTEASALASERL